VEILFFFCHPELVEGKKEKIATNCFASSAFSLGCGNSFKKKIKNL